jgi:23S rRNA pseudouridine1911/1915/1917 synthase
MDGMALDILYEDDHLLVVDKPAGIVVHPTYKNKEGTVLDMLPARAWTAGTRPSIVGRLDKLTSGIVVIAKSAAVHAAMQREMASTRTEKAYLAIVYGRVEDPHGTIDLRLRYDPRDRRRIITVEERNAPDDVAMAGWRCVTEFERLSSVDAPAAGLSLLRCQLVTGRRHQIRVHLAARGWPIVGDAQYGEPRWPEIADAALAAALRAFPRQALHAWRVAFDHPTTRQRVTIEAPLPRDFEELMAIARLKPRATTATQNA